MRKHFLPGVLLAVGFLSVICCAAAGGAGLPAETATPVFVRVLVAKAPVNGQVLLGQQGTTAVSIAWASTEGHIILQSPAGEPKDLGPGPYPVPPPGPGGFLTVNGTAYRGDLTLSVVQGSLYVINKAALESYLRGVVPKELRCPEMEAMKAQAIAARSYALSRLGRHEAEGYDVAPDETDQMYGGLSAEDARSTEAVDTTAGLVLWYQGRLVKEPLYSSTCGGRTEDNDMVFKGGAVPYLRGVPCEWPESSPALASRGATSAPAAASPSPASPEPLVGSSEAVLVGLCRTSKYYHWEERWSAAELDAAVATALGVKAKGSVCSLQVLSLSPGGRVLELEITTEAGPVTVRGDQIRKVLSRKTPAGVWRPLNSTRFRIVQGPTPDGTAADPVLIIEGWGWGHGVGMCQVGAREMAGKGATAEQILRHYYAGVTIGPWTGSPAPSPQGTSPPEEK